MLWRLELKFGWEKRHKLAVSTGFAFGYLNSSLVVVFCEVIQRFRTFKNVEKAKI